MICGPVTTQASPSIVYRSRDLHLDDRYLVLTRQTRYIAIAGDTRQDDGRGLRVTGRSVDAQCWMPAPRSATVRSWALVATVQASSYVTAPSRMSRNRCWSKVCIL